MEGPYSAEKRRGCWEKGGGRKFDLAQMGLDRVCQEMGTWKMTAVERSICSKVCLGVFKCFLADVIRFLLVGGSRSYGFICISSYPRYIRYRHRT